MKPSPVQLDGALYILIAVFATLQTIFTSDDAYKYLNPYVLWWTKSFVAVAAAACAALKMYRSTSYAEHRNGHDQPPAGASSPPHSPTPPVVP